MSRASRRLRPAVGNQGQNWSEAKKPIISTPASMVGIDHSPSITTLELTSKLLPRRVAACTPTAMAMI